MMFRDRKRLKLALSFLVILALGVTVFLPAGYAQEEEEEEGEVAFSDVPTDHWAYEDIEYLAERGIITGLPGGTYDGDEPITRYQVANLVARTVRYLQDNEGATGQQDLSTLEDLVYKLSERVDSASDTSEDLQSRVNNLESQVQELSASSGPEDYDQLVNRSENNFILGVAGIVLGAGALAWTILID